MAERTCCPTHTDTCRFGREHVWAGPFLLDGGRPVDGQVWSHPDDVHCAACAGTCTGNREEQHVADEYTPTTDFHMRTAFVTAIPRPESGDVQDRWQAAHDEAVRQEERERIAQDIEAAARANLALGLYEAIDIVRGATR